MTAAPAPTVTGFIAFLRFAGMDATVLPDNSPTIPFALSVALALVNPALNCVGYSGAIAGTQAVSIYTLAVYNLATDRVVNYAPDQTDKTFFTDMRAKMNILAFVSGVIQTAADESTSESMVVMEAAKNFTLGDLQNLKTPWGRQYLAFAQDFGEVVGIS